MTVRICAMKSRLLLLGLFLVLAGCADRAETDSATVEAASVTTTTIIAAQPAVGSPSGSHCQTVTFPPTSDEIASDMVAYGVPCAEAEEVVRKVGGPLGPEGPVQSEADGFTCVRTSVQIGHSFPVATYECKRGSDRITFSRTTAG